MARIQRWIIVWRKFEGRTSMLEHQPDRHVRCCIVDDSRLEVGKEVVYGWMVFWCYIRPRCCNARFWILHSMGLRHSWYRNRRCVQLRNQRYAFILHIQCH